GGWRGGRRPGRGEACPARGRVPWARAQPRVQDQAFREELARNAAPAAPVAQLAPAAPAKRAAAPSSGGLPPVLPPDVTQFYLPPAGPGPAGAAGGDPPRLPRVAGGTFGLRKPARRGPRQGLRLLARPAAAGPPTGWDRAEPVADALADGPLPNATWEGVPEGLDTGRKLKALEKAFADYLAGAQKLNLFENRTLGLVSEPDEPLPSF